MNLHSVKVMEWGRILTGEQHENGRAGDVAGSSTPTADDARPEGDEVEEEGDDEERNHGASHI